MLIAVGRYTVDRWGAETAAEQQGLKGAARKHAIQSCTGRHFNGIQDEAITKLREYVRRDGTMVDAATVATGVGQLTAQLKRELKPPLSPKAAAVWVGTEMLSALIALFTLAAIAGVVTLLLSAKVREDAGRQIESVLGISSSTPPASTAPPASPTSSRGPSRQSPQG